MSQQISIEIWNDRPTPHIVWIEPWGEDVTMLPKQRLIVKTISSDKKSEPWFSLVETEGNTQVYVNECGDFPRVEIEGVLVQCGHNRQAARDAGIWPG